MTSVVTGSTDLARKALSAEPLSLSVITRRAAAADPSLPPSAVSLAVPRLVRQGEAVRLSQGVYRSATDEEREAARAAREGLNGVLRESRRRGGTPLYAEVEDGAAGRVVVDGRGRRYRLVPE